MLQNHCCLAAQTQVLLIQESGIPFAGTISGSHRTCRADAGHAFSPSWPASESDIQQASSFTAGRPLLCSGDRWMPGQTGSTTGIPGRFVTDLTAGDAHVLAYAGSGETEGWLAHASAVNELRRVTPCAGGRCTESRGSNGDFAVSGAYGSAARAFVPSNSGPAMAQASQSTADQADKSLSPPDDTNQANVDPAAPDGGSTAPSEEFSGSPEPAGRDLTVSEEQSAISQGWK
jgi:hypothetical protein